MVVKEVFHHADTRDQIERRCRKRQTLGKGHAIASSHSGPSSPECLRGEIDSHFFFGAQGRQEMPLTTTELQDSASRQLPQQIRKVPDELRRAPLVVPDVCACSINGVVHIPDFLAHVKTLVI
jgi:hypothetical protein